MAVTVSPTSSRQQQFGITLAGAWLVGFVLNAAGTFGWFNGERDDDQVVGWLVVGGIAAVITAGMFWWNRSLVAAPVAARLSTRALIFGVLAFVSIPVFWLGLHPIFAATAIVLGMEAMRFAEGKKPLTFVALILAAAGFVIGSAGNLFG
ncbi:MAG TPA: hypothetical protein VI759_07205 [Dehalococcoidia bacterium]|nr:hypothetical protein [Dehalococcoidia bacterium]